MGSNVPRTYIKPRWALETPCFGCNDRAIGCHGECEKYKKFKADGLEDWKKRREAYYKERDAECFEVSAKIKTLKRKGK